MDIFELYIALVEYSDAAIVAKDSGGVVLIWNAAAERLVGYSAQEMKGRSIQALLPPDRQGEEAAIVSRVRAGDEITPFLTKWRHKSGELIDIGMSASPMRDRNGKFLGISYIARDASAFVGQQRLLRESEERFRMLADNIGQFVWIAQPDGNIVWFNRASYEFTGLAADELTGQGWYQTLHPDHAERWVERYREGLADGKAWEDTILLRGAEGKYRWFISRITPVRDAADEIVCWVGSAVDITDERERSEHVRLLLMEVNHRSKNLLATVQALARRSAPGHPDFVARFEERVRSLALNQDILVRREWREVPLAELVSLQLGLFEGAAGEMSAGGVECSLVPRAAEIIGMAMHELATNSVKYGALSVPGGRVEVGWECAGDCEHFAIWWRESGGPPVTPPTRQGFGTRLIRDVPRDNLEAEVALEYRPDGVFWSIECEASVLAAPICRMGC